MDVTAQVQRHSFEIENLKSTLERIAKSLEKQEEQLEKINQTLSRQDVILEKIANLEEKYQDGLKRCHFRIDGEKEHFEERIRRNEEKIKKNEEELKKLQEDIHHRPCVSHNLIEKDIDFLKKEVQKHNKIFWWGATLIIGVVVVGIVKSHFS